MSDAEEYSEKGDDRNAGSQGDWSGGSSDNSRSATESRNNNSDSSEDDQQHPEIETFEHVLGCNDPGISNLRTEAKVKFGDTLRKKLQTPPILSKFIIDSILTEAKGDPLPILDNRLQFFQEIVTQQSMIGWVAMARGRVHIGWKFMISSYLKNNGVTTKSIVDRWNEEFIKASLIFLHCLWTNRCNKLYNGTNSRDPEKQALIEKVEYWHHNQHLIREQDRNLLRETWSLRLTMQTPSLRGRVHSLKESEQQERQEQREIDELISGSLLQFGFTIN